MTRQFDQGNTPETDGTVSTDTIPFIVTDVRFGVDDPKIHPTVPPLYAPHPDEAEAAAGQVLDRKRVEWLNDTTARVICFYSNNRSFRFPDPPPDDDIDFADWGFTFTRTTRRIPRYVKTATIHTDGAGGAPQTIYKWLPEPFDEVTYEFGITRTVNVETFPLSALHEIQSQHGRLHQLPLGVNSLWLFESGGVERRSALLWTIRYQWTRPAVIGAFGNAFGNPIDEAGEIIENIIVPGFALLPFHDYTVIPSESFEDPPEILMERRGDRSDLQGFRQLPGNPIP